MITPTLQLNQFFMKKLNIEWIEAIKKANQMSLTVSYDVSINKDNENFYRLTFSTKLSPKRSKVSKEKLSGYKIASEIVGFFSFPESFSNKDERRIAIRINGCIILYGILRGQIATITGSFPNGKFNLPTVNMIEIIKEIEEKNIAKIKKQETLQSESNKTNKKNIKRKTIANATVKN